MTRQAEKILVVGPSWVGDMVMAQSLFIDLMAHRPDAQIDVLAPAWTGALTDRMPQVSTLVKSNFAHGKLGLGERWRLGKSLREAGYTQSICLPNSLKSALVPWLARIPVRTGFVGEQRWGLLNDARRLDKQALPMTVQRFLALGAEPEQPARALDAVPAPALRVSEQDVERVLQKNQLDSAQQILALCPGAEFGASKKWPAEHYAAVAAHYLARGWQVWLLGSDNDLAACEQINSLCGDKATVLAGKTSLPEAIDLLSLASLVVSNDSGLMHIAAGLQRPLVAVYGSTDPGHTPPLSGNHAIARLGLDCSPCFKRDCPLEHLNCLQELLPELVLSKAEALVTTSGVRA